VQRLTAAMFSMNCFALSNSPNPRILVVWMATCLQFSDGNLLTVNYELSVQIAKRGAVFPVRDRPSIEDVSYTFYPGVK
jgi:hypothetical protein